MMQTFRRSIFAVLMISALSGFNLARADSYSNTIEVFKKYPAVQPFFKNAYGYAVFPTVGKGGFGIGGAYAKGQVYRKNKVTGTAKLFKGTIGFQFASMGPMRRMDFGGLDLWLQGCRNAFAILQNSVEPPAALEKLVSEGHTGIKSGKGFYEYAVDFSKDTLDTTVQQRDRELIGRLKRHYLDKKGK